MKLKKFSNFLNENSLNEKSYVTPVEVLAYDEAGNEIEIPAGEELESTGYAHRKAYFKYKGETVSIPKDKLAQIISDKREKVLQESWDWKDSLGEDFDFEAYAEDNLGLAKKALSPRDMRHVASCLKMLAEELSGIPSQDDFIEAWAARDYKRALVEADDVNRVAFWIYHVFLYNKAPMKMKS
jgi:hypothetical protein